MAEYMDMDYRKIHFFHKANTPFFKFSFWQLNFKTCQFIYLSKDLS